MRNIHPFIFLIYVGAATVELVAVSQIKPFIQSRWSLATNELGLMSTATFLGEIFGGIVWAHLSDSHGNANVKGVEQFSDQF